MIFSTIFIRLFSLFHETHKYSSVNIYNPQLTFMASTIVNISKSKLKNKIVGCYYHQEIGYWLYELYFSGILTQNAINILIMSNVRHFYSIAIVKLWDIIPTDMITQIIFDQMVVLSCHPGKKIIIKHYLKILSCQFCNAKISTFIWDDITYLENDKRDRASQEWLRFHNDALCKDTKIGFFSVNI